jgi:hypothetical protein
MMANQTLKPKYTENGKKMDDEMRRSVCNNADTSANRFLVRSCAVEEVAMTIIDR